jgi:hypothetical protein
MLKLLSQVCFDACCFFRADGLVPFQSLRESAVGGYFGFIWTYDIDLSAGLLSADIVMIINLADVNHSGEFTTNQIHAPGKRQQEGCKSLVLPFLSFQALQTPYARGDAPGWRKLTFFTHSVRKRQPNASGVETRTSLSVFISAHA